MNIAVGIALRRVTRSQRREVVFYGHTFNGNLRALAEHIEAAGDIRCHFATLDPDYHASLKADPTTPGSALNLLSMRDAVRVARSAAVLTDRKSHMLELLNRATDLPFIDLWHGVPFKGFTPEGFRYLTAYSEVWTSSPTMSRIYVDKFAVASEKLHATGYARTDALAVGRLPAEGLRAKYGIGAEYRHIVLVAPTWKQDHRGRSIFPFGASEAEFFESMNTLGRELSTLFIFRAHLNVEGAEAAPTMDHVRNMPYAKFPLAEEFLALADLLVTDWSSMAFDYLALRRPTVFLDVEPPFSDGFTLGPEHRFGEVVSSMDELDSAVRGYLNDPAAFERRYAKEMDHTTEVAYGDLLDGAAAERQYQRLLTVVDGSARSWAR